MQLSADQLIFIGVVTTIVVQIVRLLSARTKQVVLNKTVITVVLMVVALFLAYIWARPVLPMWPTPVADPMSYALLIVDFIGKLIVVLSALFGFATIIYNLLVKAVFEKLGVGSDKISMLANKPDNITGTNGLPF